MWVLNAVYLGHTRIVECEGLLQPLVYPQAGSCIVNLDVQIQRKSGAIKLSFTLAFRGRKRRISFSRLLVRLVS